jgi:hypothetical protein
MTKALQCTPIFKLLQTTVGVKLKLTESMLTSFDKLRIAVSLHHRVPIMDIENLFLGNNFTAPDVLVAN